MSFLVGPTQPAISDKSFFIFRARTSLSFFGWGAEQSKNEPNKMPREPILSLTKLLEKFGNLLLNNIQEEQQAQHQAVLSAKESVDALTLSLLARHNFPLSPNWTVEELTAHVIEEENVNNLSFLIDTVKDLATYGATSEFFISTIRLLEQGGAWG